MAHNKGKTWCNVCFHLTNTLNKKCINCHNIKEVRKEQINKKQVLEYIKTHDTFRAGLLAKRTQSLEVTIKRLRISNNNLRIKLDERKKIINIKKYNNISKELGEKIVDFYDNQDMTFSDICKITNLSQKQARYIYHRFKIPMCIDVV